MREHFNVKLLEHKEKQIIVSDHPISIPVVDSDENKYTQPLPPQLQPQPQPLPLPPLLPQLQPQQLTQSICNQPSSPPVKQKQKRARKSDSVTNKPKKAGRGRKNKHSEVNDENYVDDDTKSVEVPKKKRSYKAQSTTDTNGSDKSTNTSNSSNLSTPPKSRQIDRPITTEYNIDYHDNSYSTSFEQEEEERDPRETTGNECFSNDALMN